jgi:phosphohistidine phosphatase
VKRLQLLRHAKSSWDDPGLSDRDRPLAPRGRKAARRLARWAEANGVRPELALCSPALRATDTLERLLPALGAPEVAIDERLYHASAETLLSCVHGLREPVADALLVGHNPGLADLCLLLARPGPERERVSENLPTGALATLELDVREWSAVRPGCAVLSGLVLPRELA